MRYQTKAAKARLRADRLRAEKVRLLADRLRRINNQRPISLAQAQEVCDRLGEIIYFLDEFGAIAGAGKAELALHSMSAARVRWEHIQRVYEMCNRNLSETARRLSMHRRTLQRTLAKGAPL
jgi:DNA-binding NtrC family response regulator